MIDGEHLGKGQIEGNILYQIRSDPYQNVEACGGVYNGLSFAGYDDTIRRGLGGILGRAMSGDPHFGFSFVRARQGSQQYTVLDKMARCLLVIIDKCSQFDPVKRVIKCKRQQPDRVPTASLAECDYDEMSMERRQKKQMRVVPVDAVLNVALTDPSPKVRAMALREVLANAHKDRANAI